VVTLAPNQKDASLTKLSISFALSQSTKLAVLEDRAGRLAEVTSNLPRALAAEGRVEIGDRDIVKLQGRVFLEQRELGILGTVLETPELLWKAPDAMVAVYEKVRGRVTGFNAMCGIPRSCRTLHVCIISI
jgi:uncharacterized Rmd1/YagE family protein